RSSSASRFSGVRTCVGQTANFWANAARSRSRATTKASRSSFWFSSSTRTGRICCRHSCSRACSSATTKSYNSPAAGGVGSRHGQDILPQPADQQGHVFRQGDGLLLRRQRMTQLVRQAEIRLAGAPAVLRLLLLQLAAGGDGRIGPVFQAGDERLDL